VQQQHQGHHVNARLIETASRRQAAPDKLELAADIAYVLPGRRRPPNWFLAHNHVLHGRNTRSGINGFRAFWVADRSGWQPCRCGWRPDLGEHYSKNPDQQLLKVVTEK
jgi:hypothetical protein